MLKLLLHPFAIVFYCILIGSFLILDNAKYADDTIPTYFHGSWSINLGFIILVAGIVYLLYSIYTTIKKNKKS